jgi:hypothetical protein
MLVERLVRTYVRITEEKDVVVRYKNKSLGYYPTRLGYQANFSSNIENGAWWWKGLWKVKAPKKEKIFMWLILMNRVFTWEIYRNEITRGLEFASSIEKMRKQNHIFHKTYLC